ncbi:hypothetical protein [Streptomyces sp. MP131-18]|uniref:hypothetical protein n=1 Tax=Streptomyces sp. MP131-18 TaxID=1857892 RepID=UPI0015C567CC|nr:hypothetical protein [Streptomyces sp. MP131-18]
MPTAQGTRKSLINRMRASLSGRRPGRDEQLFPYLTNYAPNGWAADRRTDDDAGHEAQS